MAGLPRSGSTLLCNLLDQHPDVYVSSTSALPRALNGIAELFGNSPEITSDLLNVPGSRDREVAVLQGIIENWHPNDLPVVIDKSRGWAANEMLLRRLRPDSRMLVTVRDPRDAFASTEKRLAETAEFGVTSTMMDRASQQFSEDGLFGLPIKHIEDLLRRSVPGNFYVPFEAFVAEPKELMAEVLDYLELEPFEFDFDNVESAATDADELYRFRYPHVGAGKVAPVESNWESVIGAEVGQAIADRWPTFMSGFGYVRPGTVRT